VIKILKDCNLSDVILAGPIFTRVGSGSGFKSFHDVAKLKEYLRKEHIKGFHILVKGSRGMALEQIYNLL
jgi:UDP-N-acetylmuramoyl-tripeptide--D-alanyl-D-alanine ligase